MSFLSLGLFLLTLHFSPAVVSAQDLSGARGTCDTAALAKSVWGNGKAAEALLAKLDAECAKRLINQYTTERDETVVHVARDSGVSIASMSATYCYDHTRRELIETLGLDQYRVNLQKRWCATSTVIVGTPERFKWVDIINGAWRLDNLAETHNYFVSSAVHKTNVIAYMQKGS